MSDPRVIRRVRSQEAPGGPVPAAPAGSRQLSLCRHCGRPLLTEIGGRVKLAVKSRVLAFVNGAAELNCPHCGKATPLPEVRFVVR